MDHAAARELALGQSLPDRVDANLAGHKLAQELAAKRQVLNADQLASLIAPRANFEQEFGLEVGGKRAYFFTVDGVLHGHKIHGALFAGECILVFASTFLEAQEQANVGLRTTIELLYQEYEARGIEDDLTIEVGGRKARAETEARMDPFLKKMLAHVMGNLPWVP